jgi:hypothetical protein
LSKKRGAFAAGVQAAAKALTKMTNFINIIN